MLQNYRKGKKIAEKREREINISHVPKRRSKGNG